VRDALLHELCNRASPLLALAERLRALPLPEEHRAVLAALYRSSRDVDRLLRSLRDPDDFFVPRPTEFDLGALCAELCDAARADARSAGARILLDLGAPIRAFADEVQVAEVIVNLLKNAIEAAGRSGRVVLSVEARGRVARVCVRDDGPGVSPGLAGALFSPGASTKGPGRGIGLALSRALARAQGGRLMCRRRRGETELLLLLRRARVAAPSPERPRVLVVEDDPDVRLALSAVLSDEFEVTAVESGAQALSTLESTPFDAMLTDRNLAAGPCGEALVADACRRQPALRGRIVLATGDAGCAAEVPGVARLVRKPFDASSVRRALREGIAAQPAAQEVP
jgi:CheY-like chemotaxis protein/anti-sigma regulatory factor (Ser/Thr protein kinase)